MCWLLKIFISVLKIWLHLEYDGLTLACIFLKIPYLIKILIVYLY